MLTFVCTVLVWIPLYIELNDKNKKENRMKKLILGASFLVALSGCQTTIEDKFEGNLNVPTYGKSKFDDIEYVMISNIVCTNRIAFNLFQDTNKSYRSNVLLTAGTGYIEAIGTGKSLMFKIDGNLYEFESISNTTDFGKIFSKHGNSGHFSSKKYFIRENLIREIAESQEFLVKIKLSSGGYREGECSHININKFSEGDRGRIELQNKYSGIEGFKKFVNAIDKIF